MSKLNSLQDLMIDEIRDLYHAERQITQALPKMINAANDPELKKAFQTHLEQTEGQIKRLEDVFRQLEIPARAKVCHAMLGIIEEGKEFIAEDADPDVKDAGLIACAQRVEHYEIAGYGTVRTFAQELGLSQVQQLLQQTLDEEKETDALLTGLAERRLNREAVAA
jgi:ferritin-like metal-binding protein YciE